MRAAIFIGIQASGKSSFYEKVLSPLGYVHVSMDLLHNRNREEALIRQCVSEGHNMAIDNTNPTLQERRRYLDILQAAGCPVDCYFFKSVVRDCAERNRLRMETVPEKAIAATSNKLEMPSREEGYDGMYFVQMDGKGGFSVDEWKEL